MEHEISKLIQPYIEADNGANGEVAQLLVTILEDYPDFVSEKFLKAIKKELQESLEIYQEEYNIIENTETFTKTYKILERKY